MRSYGRLYNAFGIRGHFSTHRTDGGEGSGGEASKRLYDKILGTCHDSSYGPQHTRYIIDKRHIYCFARKSRTMDDMLCLPVMWLKTFSWLQVHNHYQSATPQLSNTAPSYPTAFFPTLTTFSQLQYTSTLLQTIDPYSVVVIHLLVFHTTCFN